MTGITQPHRQNVNTDRSVCRPAMRLTPSVHSRRLRLIQIPPHVRFGLISTRAGIWIKSSRREWTQEVAGLGRTALVLGAWCVGGVILCLLTFRWSAKRDRLKIRGSVRMGA